MSRHNIRLHNLRLLIEEFGSISALAEACGLNEKYLSNVKNENPLPSGKPRGVGNAAAVKLEQGASRPAGWMDIDHRESSEKPAQGVKLAPAEHDLITLFRAAGPQKRRAIMAVARLLTSD